MTIAIRSKTLLGLALAILAVGQVAQHADAHPHVFAEARLDVLVSPEEEVVSFHHVWRFDELFSSSVLVEFDQDRDLKLNDAELETIAAVIHDSLADYNYFQMLSVDGVDVGMQPPPHLMAQFIDGQLIIAFETRPETPLEMKGNITVGIYDPTFFTAIDFIEDSYMSVENLPANCVNKVVRPDPDEAIAQNQDTLTEAFFNDPAGNDLSKIFATRLELTCSQ